MFYILANELKEAKYIGHLANTESGYSIKGVPRRVNHDDVIKWKHKGQWHGALMVS